MKPKRFGKIENHKEEPVEGTLPMFIETLYFKRFGRQRPEEVITIERYAQRRATKQAGRWARATLRAAVGAVCDDVASSPRAAAQIDLDRSEALIDRYMDATSAAPRSSRPGHGVD